MMKVYQTLKWNLVTAGTLLVMIVLYSRIVYALWFKPDDSNQLTHQQMVRINSVGSSNSTSFAIYRSKIGDMVGFLMNYFQT